MEVSGSTAVTKMQLAMAGVGSSPLLALLLAYQPQEVPLQQQETPAAVPDAGQQSAEQVLGARPVLDLPFEAAVVANSDEIQWVCLDSTKPVS